MSRTRQIKTNFSSGVLAPNMLGRIGTTDYQQGLKQGVNIQIGTTGGAERRPGSKFIRDYGQSKMVRVFPFVYNKSQKYIVVLYIYDNAGTDEGLIDIYRDNVQVGSALVTPYNTPEKIEAVDFAQSADVMVMTQGDHPPQLLRRLGSDTAWDVIPAPITNLPCDGYVCRKDGEPDQEPQCPDNTYNLCPDGECDDGSTPTCTTDFTLTRIDTWSDENGWPQLCTFHQGRLWFANCHKYPMSVWSSVSQDFFNFDLGDGSSKYSVQESLDTDYVNPIVSIYSARNLQLFTTGAEFYNTAVVITPTTSAWSRQTDYGSSGEVAPVAVDGSTLYLDSTGRTIRQFVYVDSANGYDAPSISAKAEHLIKLPKRMGVMRGSELEANAYVYVVNDDGTMAVLNISKSYGLAAWTEWNTQGFYKDVVSLDRELYILVERYIKQPDGSLKLHWILEEMKSTYRTDSGSQYNALVETEVHGIRKDFDNYWGVYYAPDGRGYNVLVWDGVVVSKSETLLSDPLKLVITEAGDEYTHGNVFSTNDDYRQIHFDEELGYMWYMYSIGHITLVDNGRNYIDGLDHLIGNEVISVLDGQVQDPQLVQETPPIPAVDYSYPDDPTWKYDTTPGNETWVQKHTLNEGAVYYEAWYKGDYYSDLEMTDFGLLIEGDPDGPVAGNKYLQFGLNVEIDASFDQVQLFTSNGSVTVPKGLSLVTAKYCAGGGGGGGGGGGHGGDHALNGDGGDGGTGGHSSPIQTAQNLQVNPDDTITITVGAGGGGGSQGSGGDFNSSGGNGGYGQPGGSTSINSTTINLFAQGATEGIGGSGGNGKLGDCSGGPGTGGSDGTYYDPQRPSKGGSGGPGTGCNSTGAPGGDASPFGAGGGGGSGGGGGTIFDDGEAGRPGGSGSSGMVELDFLGDYRIYKNKTRLMELVATTTTGGFVTFNESYVDGEAGLWFGLLLETMPLTPGDRVNEPKRIVSVTPHLLHTQGVHVNGIPQKERFFGSQALDGPAPLLTGTEKIRFLGYNKNTTVKVIQNDPLPFKLLSLDIELNV